MRVGLEDNFREDVLHCEVVFKTALTQYNYHNNPKEARNLRNRKRREVKMEESNVFLLKSGLASNSKKQKKKRTPPRKNRRKVLETCIPYQQPKNSEEMLDSPPKPPSLSKQLAAIEHQSQNLNGALDRYNLLGRFSLDNLYNCSKTNKL